MTCSRLDATNQLYMPVTSKKYVLLYFQLIFYFDVSQYNYIIILQNSQLSLNEYLYKTNPL